ncbi:ADP-glyceromanno-heptose 6-epimerase [Planktomarina sp.]|nr:ADP-glyceromanno-heptose 6-epimerase [Planktomarina sp.]MDA9100789.1 ADP-glyceromanno-heptose 6-epimerase [Planktomarina sp.]
MIIVTGGAGFIGSNLIKILNSKGFEDIMVVDDLTDGSKMHNLASLKIYDYVDLDDFINRINCGESYLKSTCVFHLGACSSTSEWDGKYLMKNNFEYSKNLLNWCQTYDKQFIYASSASVYGLGKSGFREELECETPINMYAYSKFLFDQHVRHEMNTFKAQVVGLRYFNVYGPFEAHKDNMVSPVFQFNKQIIEQGQAKLFEVDKDHAEKYRRDFIHVEDCANVNYWFLKNKNSSGIFNVGTGTARSFDDVAAIVCDWHQKFGVKDAEVTSSAFPENLRGAYQPYTQSDLSKLRGAGYSQEFISLEVGINNYLDTLNVGVGAKTGQF